MNKLGEIIELLEEHEPNLMVVDVLSSESFKNLYISLVENLIIILGDESESAGNGAKVGENV